MTARRRLLFACALAAGLLYVEAGALGALSAPDEVRVAGIGVEMVARGAWAIPTLGGEPFLEKPPLGFLSVGFATRLFGRTALAARLPSMLWGLVAALSLAALARRVYGRLSAGLGAGALLLLSPSVLKYSHRCLVDGSLLGAVTLSALCLWRFVDTPSRRGRWALAAVGACALAFFAKGAVGLVFPSLFLVGLLAVRRDAKLLRSPWFWLSPGAVIALVGLWLAGVAAEGGEAALKTVVVDNHLRRFAPAAGYAGGHERPWHYYLGKLPVVLLPSLVLLPAALAWHRRQGRTRQPLGPCLAWLGGGAVLLSLAGTKRQVYLLPLVPPAALLAGGWVAGLIGRPLTRLEDWTLRALGWAALAGALVGPGVLLGRGAPLRCALVCGWAAGAAVALFAFLALRRGRVEGFLLRVLLALLLTLLGCYPSYAAMQDRRHDLSAFFRGVAVRVPPRVPILLWEPSEATRGALRFYADRSGRTIARLAEAREATGARALVVVERVRRGRPVRVAAAEALGARVLLRARSEREAALLVAWGAWAGARGSSPARRSP
ncbi:MAG: phospholipid carrier-dependent glycosyltransferase [Planctomycetota bacterium]|nr:MAG: phospholipid carrier-dependent glycosyltransferase [Planctomycetota bacterium]